MNRYKIDEVSGLSLKRHINEHAKEYDLKQVVPLVINGTTQFYTVIMEKRDWFNMHNREVT
jgi:hypothetical protein